MNYVGSQGRCSVVAPKKAVSHCLKKGEAADDHVAVEFENVWEDANIH